MKYKKKHKKKYNNNLGFDQTFPGRISRMDKDKQIYIYLKSRRLKITYDLFHKHFKLHIWTKKVKCFFIKKLFRFYRGSLRSAGKLLCWMLDAMLMLANFSFLFLLLFLVFCRNVNLRLGKLPKNISINIHKL